MHIQVVWNQFPHRTSCHPSAKLHHRMKHTVMMMICTFNISSKLDLTKWWLRKSHKLQLHRAQRPCTLLTSAWITSLNETTPCHTWSQLNKLVKNYDRTQLTQLAEWNLKSLPCRTWSLLNDLVMGFSKILPIDSGYGQNSKTEMAEEARLHWSYMDFYQH